MVNGAERNFYFRDIGQICLVSVPEGDVYLDYFLRPNGY